MPCGKRPFKKLWEKPREMKVIKPSRYQQNEASVKVHWKNVAKELELLYKDDKFWETQCNTVRTLLGPEMFERVAKIFDLPLEEYPYQPCSEMSSLNSSENFYTTSQRMEEAAVTLQPGGVRSQTGSGGSDYDASFEDIQHQSGMVGAGEAESEWSLSSLDDEISSIRKSRSRLHAQKSGVLSKSMSKIISKAFTQSTSRSAAYMKSGMIKVFSSKGSTKSKTLLTDEVDESAATNDDLDVHIDAAKESFKITRNPHYIMLYCNESETDMIKWNSKYKQKKFEVSASDEFSKKAELLTKIIAFEFYDWWTSLGNVEFKSEIKRPEDIVDLFQVWFDEHASRGLKVDPIILPCVLQSIAEHCQAPQRACPKALKRQIAWDIYAETSPAHKMAFDMCLPQKMKHLPPQNHTKEVWHSVKIPEDLKTMSAIWGDISHITSTKAFKEYLEGKPHLPMPPCFIKRETDDKKQPFIVPSDFVGKTMDNYGEEEDIAMPVSQFSLEIKEVLSRLLND